MFEELLKSSWPYQLENDLKWNIFIVQFNKNKAWTSEWSLKPKLKS